MRVLQVHTRYSLSAGEDRVVDAERELLAGAGHDVVLHEQRNHTDALRGSRDLALSPWNAFEARRLRRVLDEVRPDVAHVHNTWFAMSPAVLRAIDNAGIPVVATLHNYRLHCIDSTLFRDGGVCRDCVGHSPVRGVRHRCYHDSFVTSAVAAAGLALHRALRTWERCVDLFIAPSAAARVEHTAAGIAPDQIVVKPHFAVDPGPRPAPPSASRTIVYAGRLSDLKGVDLLLRAWDEAAPEGTELVFLGDGPMRDQVAAAGPNRRYVGAVSAEEIRRRLLEARAVVFPSVWVEPFGMVLIEAMSCATAVVASDAGAVREVLGGIEDSLVVPHADVPALRAALARIAVDDALADRVGNDLRRRYEAGFRPEGHALELQRIYEEAGRRRAARR